MLHSVGLKYFSMFFPRSSAPIGMAILCVGAACAIVSLIGYCGACCNYKIILYLVRLERLSA